MRTRPSIACRHPIIAIVAGALLAVAAPQHGLASTQEELSSRANVAQQQIAELRITADVLAANGADGEHLEDAGKNLVDAERMLTNARRSLADAAAKDAEGELRSEEGNEEAAEQARTEADALRVDAESKLDFVDARLVEAQGNLILSVLKDGANALSVNTRDGASLFKFVFEIEMVTDASVVGNSALSIASCTECSTLAIATQILLISGDATVVTPENLALALNIDCSSCQTAAFAYQFIYSTEEDFTLSKEASKMLNEIEHEMASLGHAYARGELNAFELAAALDPLVAQLGTILTEEVAAYASLHATPSPSASPTSATPDPSTSSAPADPSPSASPTPTSADPSTSDSSQTSETETAPSEAESPTPSASPEPDESPTPSGSPGP